MYEILLWQLKLVSTIFILAIKIKLLKNYRKCFCFTKKYPFVLEIINFLHFFLPLFPFFGIPDIIEEVDDKC